MGGDESHFNVSVGSDGQSHKTVSTNHNLFEEKGEPKRNRTEVLPLTSLTPLPLGHTGSPMGPIQSGHIYHPVRERGDCLPFFLYPLKRTSLRKDLATSDQTPRAG